MGAAALVVGLLWFARDDTAAEPSVAEATAATPTMAPTRRVLEGGDTPDAEVEPTHAIPSLALGGGPEPQLTPVRGCARGRVEGCSFLEPDDDTLQEMARCGIVRYDFPRFLDQPDHPEAFDEQWAEQADLTDSERQQLEAVARTFRGQIGAEAVALAEEAGLDPAWANKSPLLIVVGMVQSKLEQQDHLDSLQRIARERAGLVPPPKPGTPQSLSDRTARFLAGVGDRFEQAVAGQLGEQRAYELREAADGWMGMGRSLGNRCPDPEPPPPAERSMPTTLEDAQECLATWREGTCRFLEPNQIMLDEMARCGIVRYDFPSFMTTRDAETLFDAEWAEEVGMTPAESAVVAEVGEAFRQQLYSDVVDLTLEIGRSREWAEETPLMGLMMALHEEVEDDTDIEEIFDRIAQERAGQRPAPEGPPDDVHEKFIRKIVEMGPKFEQALAERLGPERARQLRTHGDGWPEVHVQTSSHCKDE